MIVILFNTFCLEYFYKNLFLALRPKLSRFAASAFNFALAYF